MEQDGLEVTISGFGVQSLIDIVIQLHIEHIVVIRRFVVEGRPNIYYMLLF